MLDIFANNANVTIKISQNVFEQDFTLEIDKLTRQEVNKLVSSLTSVVETQYTNLTTMSYDQQQALALALRAYNDYTKTLTGTPTKIEQIKHIRRLSNLSLLEAKQLVEYICYGETSPIAWKFA